jgi:hypothetical protein
MDVLRLPEAARPDLTFVRLVFSRLVLASKFRANGSSTPPSAPHVFERALPFHREV